MANEGMLKESELSAEDIIYSGFSLPVCHDLEVSLADPLGLGSHFQLPLFFLVLYCFFSNLEKKIQRII